jgi:Kef-type K+ transport system membrane component KefB
VTAIAFGAPLALGLLPGLRIPAVVAEIALGIAVGPNGLGWVEIDEPVEIMSLLGLAFLLFLAGLELDLRKLRGERLRLAAAGFGASVVLGLVVGYGLKLGGLADAPMLIAVALVATSLGVVVPVLKDSGEAGGDLGQLVIAAASIADFGAIVLLSIFFTGEEGSATSQLILLALFAALVTLVALSLSRAERSSRLSGVLVSLMDTTAQIRVRGAWLLLVALVALSAELGLELILGAFAAGAMLAIVDRDDSMTHPLLHFKLEAAGYGIFIPAFFVVSGMRFDLGALTSSASALAQVPVFLLALLLVRGLPALSYRRLVGVERARAAGLLQATSLPFIVTATMIGADLGLVEADTAAALVSAGMLSVLLFPSAALGILRGAGPRPGAGGDIDPTPDPSSSDAAIPA